MAHKRFCISEAEKRHCMDQLCDHLALLRAKAGIAQDELSVLVGISRQTYGAIERKVRPMSWNTYLSLLLFFDYNQDTHQAMRSLGIYPQILMDRFNSAATTDLIPAVTGNDPEYSDILEQLDARALHAINTVIMLEYARCTDLPGTSVVKSFDGRQFHTRSLTKDARIQKALSKLKESEE